MPRWSYTAVGALLIVAMAVMLLTLWPSPREHSPLQPPHASAEATPARKPSRHAENPAGRAPPTAQERITSLREAAAGGDPAAMYALHSMAMRCVSMAYDRAPMDIGIERMANHLLAVRGTAAASAHREAGRRLSIHCEALALPGTTLLDQALRWRGLAAAAGSLPARIRTMHNSLHHDGTGLAALLDETLASGDSTALHEIGPLLVLAAVRGHTLPGYEGLDFTVFDHYALQLLACERGMDCGSGSEVMDELCLAGLQCAVAEDFEQAVRQHAAMESGDPHAGSAELEQALQRMRALLATPDARQ